MRSLVLTSEKGTSSWSNAMPSKRHLSDLTKSNFWEVLPGAIVVKKPHLHRNLFTNFVGVNLFLAIPNCFVDVWNQVEKDPGSFWRSCLFLGVSTSEYGILRFLLVKCFPSSQDFFNLLRLQSYSPFKRCSRRNKCVDPCKNKQLLQHISPLWCSFQRLHHISCKKNFQKKLVSTSSGFLICIEISCCIFLLVVFQFSGVRVCM